MFYAPFVPLDGSILAERALPLAEQVAAAGNGRAILFRAVVPPLPVEFDTPQHQRTAAIEVEAYITRIARSVASRVPVEVAVGYGRAAEAIVQEAEARRADCIVMATHGRSGLSHLVFGSVADSVVALSALPVLLVRCPVDGHEQAPFEPARSRVLVALDQSEFAECGLDAALGLVGPSSQVTLVSVVAASERALRGSIEAMDQEAVATREARVYLEGVARKLQGRMPRLPITIDVRPGQAVDGILVAASSHAADVIALSTHGRTGLERIVLGSVAGRVVGASRTPVLLVRPATLAPAMLPALVNEARATGTV